MVLVCSHVWGRAVECQPALFVRVAMSVALLKTCTGTDYPGVAPAFRIGALREGCLQRAVKARCFPVSRAPLEGMGIPGFTCRRLGMGGTRSWC